MSYFKIPTLLKALLAGFCFLLFSASCFAQEGYPEPEKTTNRLFYIQHSKNHNTYVYDANISNGVLNVTDPVTEYEIVYTEEGQKRPLSGLQRRMAYGMTLEESNGALYKLSLAASDKIYFYLIDNQKHGPRIFITVNEKKMYLDKIYIKLERGFFGFKTKAAFALLYGKDFETGEQIVEKMIMD
ncbi:DUF4833 domain-containing protein [Flavobacterium frigidarium]|uniref:DUF4833 domain-containing protein n=1 Tax=Flavobacterium frigidarium TaxID=99286 RepID=UPI00041FBB70|nr:DUF4833 domain-containing protein [Flavobacterium frigidarium]